MKFSSLVLGVGSLAAYANAQYFSEGWAPGKPVPSAKPSSSAGFDPAGTAKAAYTAASSYVSPPQPKRTGLPTLKELQSYLDPVKLLSTGPVSALAATFGINMTERLEQMESAKDKFWDHRVTQVRDDNYDALVVNEVMTEQEEKERIWFMVVTVTASGQEGISKYVDSVFDAAYNRSLLEGDLPHVRWGRVDYLNVTALTTKWVIWSAPYIVIATDRGQTLRFWKASKIRLTEDVIREFLKEGGWRTTPPWKTAYSPGGEREWVMDYLAVFLTNYYEGLLMLPRWLLYLLTGTVGSVAIGLLHRSPSAAKGPGSIGTPKIVVSQPTGDGGDVKSATSPARVASGNTAKKSVSGKGKKSGRK